MAHLAEQRGRWTRATSMAKKFKVELLAHGIEVVTGARQTGAMMERVRTTGMPEGRRRPVESKGWRVEVLTETRKSVVEAER